MEFDGAFMVGMCDVDGSKRESIQCQDTSRLDYADLRLSLQGVYVIHQTEVSTCAQVPSASSRTLPNDS